MKRCARWRLDAPTPMERVRILDPKPDPASVRETHRRAVDCCPHLREAPIASAWAGYVDSTPDGVPGIGEVPEVPGFILAAGFSGHGFGIGPGAGHLIADLVTGAEPIVDPAPFGRAGSASRRGARWLISRGCKKVASDFPGHSWKTSRRSSSPASTRAARQHRSKWLPRERCATLWSV